MTCYRLVVEILPMLHSSLDEHPAYLAALSPQRWFFFPTLDFGLASRLNLVNSMQLCPISKPRSQEIHVLLVSFLCSCHAVNTRRKQPPEGCKIGGLRHQVCQDGKKPIIRHLNEAQQRPELTSQACPVRRDAEMTHSYSREMVEFISDNKKMTEMNKYYYFKPLILYQFIM